MKRFTIMIKPASSLCDMRCGYCFYSDVSSLRQEASIGKMNRETVCSLIKNVFSEMNGGDHITFAFQGGEPALMGLDFYRFFTGEVKKNAPGGVTVGYAFQTNGLTIDDQWCLFFKDNDFLIGLSLDCDPVLHNNNRKDIHGEGTYDRVMAAKAKLDEYDVMYNILCVLTSENAGQARRLWDFILKENTRYIQFIPCLEPLEAGAEHSDNHKAALSGELFYKFYSDLFPLWKNETEKGNIISIKLFDDLTGLLLYGQKGTCGLAGRCLPQFVAEADGGVYPCDFYVLDKNRVSDLTKHSLREVFNAVVCSGFLATQSSLPAHCINCAYNHWCMGGCKRMSKAVYGKTCGMRPFLDKYLQELLSIKKLI